MTFADKLPIASGAADLIQLRECLEAEKRLARLFARAAIECGQLQLRSFCSLQRAQSADRLQPIAKWIRQLAADFEFGDSWSMGGAVYACNDAPPPQTIADWGQVRVGAASDRWIGETILQALKQTSLSYAEAAMDASAPGLERAFEQLALSVMRVREQWKAMLLQLRLFDAGAPAPHVSQGEVSRLESRFDTTPAPWQIAPHRTQQEQPYVSHPAPAMPYPYMPVPGGASRYDAKVGRPEQPVAVKSVAAPPAMPGNPFEPWGGRSAGPLGLYPPPEYGRHGADSIPIAPSGPPYGSVAPGSLTSSAYRQGLPLAESPGRSDWAPSASAAFFGAVAAGSGSDDTAWFPASLAGGGDPSFRSQPAGQPAESRAEPEKPTTPDRPVLAEETPLLPKKGRRSKTAAGGTVADRPKADEQPL